MHISKLLSMFDTEERYRQVRMEDLVEGKRILVFPIPISIPVHHEHTTFGGGMDFQYIHLSPNPVRGEKVYFVSPRPLSSDPEEGFEVLKNMVDTEQEYRGGPNRFVLYLVPNR